MMLSSWMPSLVGSYMMESMHIVLPPCVFNAMFSTANINTRIRPLSLEYMMDMPVSVPFSISLIRTEMYCLHLLNFILLLVEGCSCLRWLYIRLMYFSFPFIINFMSMVRGIWLTPLSHGKKSLSESSTASLHPCPSDHEYDQKAQCSEDQNNAKDSKDCWHVLPKCLDSGCSRFSNV